MKMSSACSFILMQIKNGFALRLALKQRHKGTRKWPISYNPLKKAFEADLIGTTLVPEAFFYSFLANFATRTASFIFFLWA